MPCYAGFSIIRQYKEDISDHKNSDTINIGACASDVDHEMASGIEVAGLVLAVIPLITKAAESCREGGRMMSLLRSRGHKQLRRRLSEDLYIELVLFHNHLKHLIQGLPDLSEARCNAVLSSFDQQDWKSDSDIVQALQSHLGQPDFDKFAHAIDNVYQWMNDVLQDESFQSQFGVQVRRKFRSQRISECKSKRMTFD